jgi:hypothetical protein
MCRWVLKHFQLVFLLLVYCSDIVYCLLRVWLLDVCVMLYDQVQSVSFTLMSRSWWSRSGQSRTSWCSRRRTLKHWIYLWSFGLEKGSKFKASIIWTIPCFPIHLKHTIHMHVSNMITIGFTLVLISCLPCYLWDINCIWVVLLALNFCYETC